MTDVMSSGGVIDVHLVDSSWSEKTLTHNNAPVIGQLIGSSGFISSSQDLKFLAIEIPASVVQDWLDGTIPNFGVALLPGQVGMHIILNSKENALTSHQAELEVEPLHPVGGKGSVGVLPLEGDPSVRRDAVDLIGEVRALRRLHGERVPERRDPSIDVAERSVGAGLLIAGGDRRVRLKRNAT